MRMRSGRGVVQTKIQQIVIDGQRILLERLAQISHLSFEFDGCNALSIARHELSQHPPQPPTFEPLQERVVMLAPDCPMHFVGQFAVESSDGRRRVDHHDTRQHGMRRRLARAARFPRRAMSLEDSTLPSLQRRLPW